MGLPKKINFPVRRMCDMQGMKTFGTSRSSIQEQLWGRGKVFLNVTTWSKARPGRIKFGSDLHYSFLPPWRPFPRNQPEPECYHLGEGPGFLEAQREVVLVEVSYIEQDHEISWCKTHWIETHYIESNEQQNLKTGCENKLGRPFGRTW